MSCHECGFISGHAVNCSQYIQGVSDDTEWLKIELKEAQEKIASLTDRVERLENVILHFQQFGRLK